MVMLLRSASHELFGTWNLELWMAGRKGSTRLLAFPILRNCTERMSSLGGFNSYTLSHHYHTRTTRTHTRAHTFEGPARPLRLWPVHLRVHL